MAPDCTGVHVDRPQTALESAPQPASDGLDVSGQPLLVATQFMPFFSRRVVDEDIFFHPLTFVMLVCSAAVLSPGITVLHASLLSHSRVCSSGGLFCIGLPLASSRAIPTMYLR